MDDNEIKTPVLDHRRLSLPQLAGQRIMVGFDGLVLEDELKGYIRDQLAGGVVLFSRNVADPDQVAALTRSIMDFALDCGQPPPFIAVDQEGGREARLKAPFTEFPGNPSIRTREEALAFADACARDLRRAGFNMNYAPVLDVAVEGFADSVMEGRVFPGDAAGVAALGEAVISRFQENGILAVGKHFPGIGRTTLDSHKDLPVSDVPREDLFSVELVPFRAAARCQAAGIMLGHVIYRNLDPDWPASLSVAVARDILRGQLGYQGVVMTDDLDMGAVNGRYPIPLCMERVFAADIDQVLICHPGPNVAAAFDAAVRLLESDPDILDRGRASAQRILAAKKRMAFIG